MPSCVCQSVDQCHGSSLVVMRELVLVIVGVYFYCLHCCHQLAADCLIVQDFLVSLLRFVIHCSLNQHLYICFVALLVWRFCL